MNETKRQEILHYIQLQKYEKAIALAKAVLSESPNDGEAVYLMSTCLNNLGNVTEALSCALDCVRMEGSNFAFSNSDMINSLLGMIYLNLGEYKKSEEHYLEALRQHPDDALYVAKYAWLMMVVGQTEKARTLLEEAKRIDSLNQNVKSIENEIKILLSKEKNQSFVPDLENGNISVDELLHLGNDCIDKKKYKEAKEYFRQVFIMQPENSELCETLNELEKATSLWMLPMRIINKIGSIKIWLIFMVLILTLHNLGQERWLKYTAITYLVIVIYSYTAGKLYDVFMKNRF